MKVLITGCFGFVGAYLVRHIVERDPSAITVAVDRHAPPRDFPQVSTTYSIDLMDLGALAEMIERERPDHIVHLASFSSVGESWKLPVHSFTNNTNIFLNLLECVRRHSPGSRILSVGSSEEYGIVDPAALPLTESAPLRPVSPYAVARVAQEHLAEVYVRGFGLDIVGTRSFNHLGAGQSDRFVLSAITKQLAEFAKGKRDHLAVGTTSVTRDFLDVRDVVIAYCDLLERGARGQVYNVCSGRGISIAGAIEIIQRATGVAAPLRTDPALVRPVENELVIGSHEKLTAAVGWRPTRSLEESLRSVYDYWFERV